MANLGKIRTLCESKKITIRELAQRIGRDDSSIQSAIRRGSTNTSTLEAIARELGVSAGIFFDGYSDNEMVELRRENEHLKELLNEKERLIQVLMMNETKDNVGTKSAQ
ncbi:MAG: helix-turn-helix domain-containing protein [Lepagella sp.]